MWSKLAVVPLGLAVFGLWWFTTGAPRHRTYAPLAITVAVPGGADIVARGQHMAEAIAVCTICHGEDLGGKLAFEDAFLGRGYTPNLTSGPGGIGRRYTDPDWARAIRFGVKPDGSGILFMPSDHYTAMTDNDLGALIAYLKSLPPVDNPKTRLELGFWARLMIDTGLAGDVVRAATIDMTATPWTRQDSPARYLVQLAGCSFCHGNDLMGGQGPEPGAPGGPRLVGRTWPLATFDAAMRAGQAPDGHRINPKHMPWQGYARMTDAEVETIWRYLR